MHIDPLSIVVFNIVISLLMSVGLFVVSRNYLTDVKSIYHWATALLLLALCGVLFALHGIIPNFFSMTIGTILGLLGLVSYFHALMTFKGLNIDLRWLYILVAIAFIGHIYFVHISFNMAGKIFVTSLSTVVLLLANSVLLLTKQQGVRPISHRLTAALFAFAACIYAIRAIYYLVCIQSEHSLFWVNFIQDITYLTNAIFNVGTSFGFMLMCNDKYVDERKRMEQHLRDNEEKFRSVIKKMPLALGLTNERDELIFINDRFKSTFGYSLADLPTIEHWWPLAYPDEKYRQQVIATWTTAVENAARLGTDIEPLEYRITCKNAMERVMLVSGIGFAEGHIYTYIDMTERKAAEEEIKQLAFFDPLTGLPNRRKLLDRLHYAIALNHRNQSQFAVFMMDLDKFKAVNDKLGHAAGDELLKQVAARITTHLRDSDMVARLGGDEFVLVLENLKILEDAETVALKVIQALTIPFQLSENNSVQIGASIGISLYPQHGNSPETLMDHADTALYQAKDNGRGCFAYFVETESPL